MGAPDAPTPADPNVTAGTQTAQNVDTAVANTWLNNPDQYTPDGSITREQTGTQTITGADGRKIDVPTFSVTQSLSENNQLIKDQSDQTKLGLATLANDQTQKISDLLSTPFTLDGLPEGGKASDIQTPQFQQYGEAPSLLGDIADAGSITKTYGTDFSQDRLRVEDALRERMQPSIDARYKRMESRLADQGIQMGSQAYSDASRLTDQAANDAELGIIAAGGQEQSRLAGLEAQRASFENQAQQQQFGQNASLAQFGNSVAQQDFANQNQQTSQNNAIQQALLDAQQRDFANQNLERDRALNEASYIRSNPLNEINALQSGSQIAGPQQVGTNTAGIANTDFAGLQSNYDNILQKQHQQKAQSRNALFGGLIGGGMNLLTGGFM